MKHILSALILFLLPCGVFGQITVNILGPEETNPGDLVILEVATEANHISWFLGNSEKTFLPIEHQGVMGKKLVFSSGTPGDYKFFCVAVKLVESLDKPPFIDVTSSTFTVHIRGNIPPPSPVPVPPGPVPVPPVPPEPSPPPVPVPDGYLKELYLSALSVNSPSRFQEAQKVSAIFGTIRAKAAGLSTYTPADMLKETGDRMEAELGASWELWLPFRNQFTQSLINLKLSKNDKPGHLQAWEEISQMLKSVR